MTKIIIKNTEGQELTNFMANHEESLGTQIQENNIPLTIACGVGACGMCKGKVLKGKEYLNLEAFGIPQYPLEENEVLTCICGLQKDVPEDAEIEIEFENL